MDASANDEEAPALAGERAPSARRVRVALVLMALSFLPYVVALWILGASDHSTWDNVVVVTLVVVSNVMWTGGMLLGGKVVYDRWKERRRLRRSSEGEAAEAADPA